MSNERETDMEVALSEFRQALVESCRKYKVFRWAEAKMLLLLNWLSSKL